MVNITMTAMLSVLTVCWLAAVVAVIGLKLLDGSISTAGLLSSGPENSIDPERLQMLIGTMGGAAYYAVLALSQPEGTTSLPAPPSILIGLIGGSQLLYLTGKLTRTIGGNFT